MHPYVLHAWIYTGCSSGLPQSATGWSMGGNYISIHICMNFMLTSMEKNLFISFKLWTGVVTFLTWLLCYSFTKGERDLPETVRLLLARTWCIDKRTVKFVIKSNETNKTEQRSCKNCGHYTALALSYIIDLDLEETKLLPSCGIFQPFTPVHQDHQLNHWVLHFWSVIFRIVTANTGTHIITSLYRKLFKNKLLWAVVTSV